MRIWPGRANRSTVMRVTVFDSDGSNPYGSELASNLEAILTVEFCAPSDIAPRTSSKGLRPRFASSRPSDLFRELCAVFIVGFKASAQRPVIVVWARTYQKLILSLLAGGKREALFVIVHNPTAARWPQGRQAVIERILLNRAVLLVHADVLGEQLRSLTGKLAYTVPHPPYAAWAAAHAPKASPSANLNDRPIRVLIFGRHSPDKFKDVQVLVDAFDKTRKATTLRLLTRPFIEGIRSGSFVTVENNSRTEWISDAVLAESLAWADIVVAPYEGATESGTVNLALSVGLRVVAFDAGALSTHLLPIALVPLGDYTHLARTALHVVEHSILTNRWSLNDRLAATREQWIRVLRHAEGQSNSTADRLVDG